MSKIALAGRTDVGLKRSNNEDTFIVRPELDFCLVADGICSSNNSALLYVVVCLDLLHNKQCIFHILYYNPRPTNLPEKR